jgi:hypothetical protein
MIVTDRMVFLHLHKSGGTFVNEMLLRCVRPAAVLGYHLPYRELPAEYRDRPVVGTVRNPWAYYVSWYHFQLMQQNRNILFQVCSDGGRLDFGGTIRNLLGLSEDQHRLAALEEALPDIFPNIGLNLTKRCLGDLRGSRTGFYTFLYNRLYKDANSPIIMPVERLREGIREALGQVGHLPNACVEAFLQQVPPLNVSRHQEPASYFDSSLASLVAERDEAIVVRYAYSL